MRGPFPSTVEGAEVVLPLPVAPRQRHWTYVRTRCCGAHVCVALDMAVGVRAVAASANPLCPLCKQTFDVRAFAAAMPVSRPSVRTMADEYAERPRGQYVGD